ncbi:MAG: hypothetical protein II296_03365, partial [Bacteroidaceae bacterium]|nr:hypothetical protein [Bacteroidaceae bacterium]
MSKSLMRTNHAMLHSMLVKVTFKKYSTVKITSNEHRKGADKSVKVFLARRGAAKLTHSRVVFLWGKLPTS